MSDQNQAPPPTPRKRVFHELLDHLPDPVLLIEPDTGCLVDANWAACHELGYARHELLALHLHEVDGTLSAELFHAAVAQLRASPALAWEGRFERRDGSSFPADVKLRYVRLQRDYVLVAARNISDSKQREDALKLAAMVYENSREAMMVTDADGTIVAINPTFTRITGYTMEEVLGNNPRMLQSREHGLEFYAAMWAQLHKDGHWTGEIIDVRKDGTAYPAWLSINAVYDGNGAVQSWIAQFSDITEKKDAEQQIWRQANFDQLTGLPNRRMFLDRLNEEIKKSRRSGRPMALLFLDLDHFKHVNDSLGHDMGDLLLRQAAERLRECVRESDTIARLGGDEFTLILGNLSDSDRVGAIAQKILWKLAEPFTLGSEQAQVSGSIGITLYPADASDAEGLLRNADQAMYGSKKAGRGCYRYYTPAMQDAALQRIQMCNDLREAVALEQLSVVYQPIYALRSGRIEKAEALVRWQHPREGMISPARFIPVAEDCGLIGAIGDLVFRDVVRNCKEWLALQPGIQVSLNKSPAQFNSGGREGQTEPWLRLLHEQQLAGNSIVVEIPEGLLLDARPEITRQLRALREAGIGIALDDFGTGYSSLACLRRYDVDYLKIDPSFIRQLQPGSEGQILCRAVISMAHDLGLQVVAEGVETAAQADLLLELGCDLAQGYHYSPALGAAEIGALLRAQNG